MLSSMAARVIHTGQALVDEVAEIQTLPERGQNAMATGFGRYAGASSNVLIAAARSGASCVQAGSVGTGPNGELIRATFAAEGIAISSPPITDQDSGICFVMVEASAERTFVTTLGAERRISVASLSASDPAPGDLVCVSGYTLLGATGPPLVDWLGALPPGVDVVLDPGAALADAPPDLVEAVVARTTVWTSNAAEASARTGAAPIAQAAAVIARDVPVVIVRDGARGCVLVVDGELTEVPGFPQHAVDTNGAGDTHTGILVAERSLGTPWSEAARRANAGAALKVTRRGPATAPTRVEIDAFLAAH